MQLLQHYLEIKKNLKQMQSTDANDWYRVCYLMCFCENGLFLIWIDMKCSLFVILIWTKYKVNGDLCKFSSSSTIKSLSYNDFGWYGPYC